jgi:group II intron reverse transcriptase/maturase
MAKVIPDWIKRKQELLAMQSQEGKTFSNLYQNLCDTGFIWGAMENILCNKGARTAGIDGITKEDLKAQEKREELVYGIVEDMRNKTYQPQPTRRVYILKDNGKQRPLGIATIRDRIVQEAIRLLLDPIYESRFHKHSYGFRQYRSTHHAALRAKDLIGRRGYTYIVEGDIKACFDEIDHTVLLKILRQTVKDESLIKAIHKMLKAGVIDFGELMTIDVGVPQGAVVSPLLANVYLNELDNFIDGFWATLPNKYQQRYKVGTYDQACPCFIVRYADDFVILTKNREDAERMKRETETFLRDKLKLRLSAEKTLITRAEDGFDFLGFNIRKWDRRTLIKPSKKAVNKFKQVVRERIKVAFSLDDAAAVAYINQYLIGWAMYYRSVSSSQTFRYLDHFVWHRIYKTSKRMRGGNKVTKRGHYKKHYIPYRYDIKESNRRYRGRNYGAWLDEERTKALVVVRMAFVKIVYNKFHPQLNPYMEAERLVLENKVDINNLPSTSSQILLTAAYGVEWRVLRKIVLEQAHHRCEQCDDKINGRNAHVHHIRRLQEHNSRTQANKYKNLMAVCPKCHASLEVRQQGII